MNFAEALTGTVTSNLESNEVARESRRMCQEIRTYQSQVSVALVAAVGIAYLFSLWNRTDSISLLIGILCIFCITVNRTFVCRSLRKTLDSAGPEELMRNEVRLFLSGVGLPFVLGLGYWFVAVPGDERTVLAITVLSCVYAVGATINAATQTRTLPIYLMVNLGQAILFWAGLGNRTDYALALMLACLFVLLFAYAVRNRAFIVEAVRMRLENKSHNERLIENRALVEGALESALEANRSKSRFIAAASHDLAQPVHALSFLLESLKTTVDENSKQACIVEKIESSVGILERQFDGFVDLSRYDANELEVQWNQFDLTAMCQILVVNAEPKAQEKNIELSLQGKARPITSDSILLGRIIGNLLDNAIKFSDGGLVQLRLSERDNWVIIEISDTGIGICKEDLPRIFGDFVQLKNPARTSALGAGLGLSIVRRIASLLGIEISVDSAPGEGTTFTLIVPVARAAGRIAVENFPVVSGLALREFGTVDASMAFPSISLQGRVVLLVDDESSNTDALGRYIQDLGGRSLVAADYEEGLQLAVNNTVDLAIIDDMLGIGPTGLELSSALVSQLGQDRIVIVTGNDSTQRLKDIEGAGFTVYSKPLKVQQLLAILSGRLGISLK